MARMATPWKDPRTGIYYIRRRVPKDLVQAFGELYKKSLKTKDLSLAKRLFASEWVSSEEAFAMARSRGEGPTVLTSSDIQQLASRWFTKELQRVEEDRDFKRYLVTPDDEGAYTLAAFTEGRALPFSMVEEAITQTLKAHGITLEDPQSELYGRVYEAFSIHMMKLSEIALARSQGDWIAQPVTVPEAPLSTAKVVSTVMKMSELFKAWKTDKIANDGEGRGVLKSLDEYEGVIDRFIELYGDLPVDQVDRKLIQQYRLDLQRCPATKANGIRLLPIRQQIEKVEAEGLPTISMVTITNRLKKVSALLGFAIELGLITENPVSASGVTKRIAQAQRKSANGRKRKDYNLTELNAIFRSPVFNGEGWAPQRSQVGQALYWIPLLALYMGARREELCQLFAKDVRKSPEGIHYVSILNTEDEEDQGRSVKTSGSRRDVPIHPDLIELGFLEYAASVPVNGQLFPHLPPDPKGFYGNAYGKHWTNYLREVVKLESPAAPSHGFRHTFKTLCREADIPEEVHDALTGHSDGSVSRDYGHMPLVRLAKEMAKIPSIARKVGLL